MPDSCTCGAKLPLDARFCHKCGRPLFDPSPDEIVADQAPVAATVQAPPPPPEISFGNRTAVRAGFLAALLAVLLVIFPLPFQFLRLTLGFLGSGFLAVYLYKRRTGQPLTLVSGARMGWITGIFAFTIFMAQLTLGVIASSSEGGLAAIVRQQLPPNDARTKQFLEILQQPSALVSLVLLVLAFFFVFLTLLPTLGGLLGAKFLTRPQRTL